MQSNDFFYFTFFHKNSLNGPIRSTLEGFRFFKKLLVMHMYTRESTYSSGEIIIIIILLLLKLLDDRLYIGKSY